MSRTDQTPLDINWGAVSEDSTSELPSTWKEASRSWGHSLHTLSPYVGGFPATLAHYFIRWFTDVGDTVFDPFCGGGTTPLEAAINNRYALGNDAFSYAYTVSYAKCNPLSDEDLKSYLRQKVTEANHVDNTNMRLLDNDDLTIFYSKYTLDQILRLREVLYDDYSREGLYLKALMCGILHGPSDLYLSLQTKDTYSGTANYVKKYAEKHELERPERDVEPRIHRKHDRIQTDLKLPWIGSRSEIIKGDARNTPFDEGEADFILTSPPYMGVLDYTWNNWLRLWWLKEDRTDERDNLDLTMDVKRYRTFMRECLLEMYRVLAKDSVAVLVVGDVKKSLAAGKRTLNTAGHIAEEAAERTDFEVHGVIEDAYDVDNRGYVVFNQLKYDYNKDEKREKAKVPIDRCLLLTKGNPVFPDNPSIDWEIEFYKR